MGQEASVLADGRDTAGIDANSLEEQARAPPSAVHPNSSAAVSAAAAAAASSHAHNLSPMRDSKPRKLITSIPSMFQRGLVGNKDPPHSHDTESFEQREAARAAAAGGNLYYGPSSSESFLDESDNGAMGYSTLQKLPPQNATVSEHNQALQTSASMFSLGGHHDVATTADSANIDAVTRTVTVIPDKKSIFSGRASARGMINSMRNLTIGNALQRKPKEVNDWEKQWDEDDDDSDDGQHDTGISAAAAASGLRPGVGGLESGQYKANAIPPPPPPPAGTAPKSPVRHDALYYATPPPPPPTSTAVDLLSTASLLPPSLVTPPPPQYPPYVTPPLSQPQTQHSSGGQALDVWETDASLPPTLPHAYDVRKPDVDMFLPVLRVLGKGSFGKVRVVSHWTMVVAFDNEDVRSLTDISMSH
jgi:hypothetical protein